MLSFQVRVKPLVIYCQKVFYVSFGDDKDRDTRSSKKNGSIHVGFGRPREQNGVGGNTKKFKDFILKYAF